MKKTLLSFIVVITTVVLSNAQTVLLNEGFEENGTMPSGWLGTGTYSNSGGPTWQESPSGHGGLSYCSAHTGNYFGTLWDGGFNYCTTDLITPSMNFSGYTSVTLNFYYIASNFFGYQDSLAIFYKTSSSGSLIPLHIPNYVMQTNSASPQWTSTTFTISSGSATTYIVFRGIYNTDDGINLDDIKITGYGTTGINEVSNSKYNLQFYPNPVSDLSTLYIPEGLNEKDLSFTVYNILGQSVMKQEIHSGQSSRIELNKNDLATGLYIFRLTDSEKIVGEGKVIIQ